MNEVLLLDVILGGVCALGFVYCVLAGRRMSKLYRNRESLEALLEELSGYEAKNKEQIAQLEAQLKGLYERWEEALQKGEDLKGDLDYFISRGESLLKEMDPKVRELRSLAANSEKKGQKTDSNISLLASRQMSSLKENQAKRMAG